MLCLVQARGLPPPVMPNSALLIDPAAMHRKYRFSLAAIFRFQGFRAVPCPI